jgi:hypothetical protein
MDRLAMKSPATLRRCSAEAATLGVATAARGLVGPGRIAVLRERLMNL